MGVPDVSPPRPRRGRRLAVIGAGLLVLVLAVALGVRSLAGGDSAADRRNALWVWHQVPPRELLDVATAHQVGRLLVWVAPGFSGDRASTGWLAELHRAAAADGVALDALGGDPQWAVQPELATQWASEAAASGWFARLHLDVEPHALAQWRTASTTLLDGMVTALRNAAGAGLPVDADVPYWLGTVRTSAGVDGLSAVCRVAASITVMAYQDRASAIERVSAAAVSAAARAGIPVWVGVNLREPAADEPSSSLWGQDRATTTAVLAGVAAMPGVAGVALHDADALMALDGA